MQRDEVWAKIGVVTGVGESSTPRLPASSAQAPWASPSEPGEHAICSQGRSDRDGLEPPAAPL